MLLLVSGHPIFKGTTHMMMLGTNNLEIADVILNWADANIPPGKQNSRNKELISSASSVWLPRIRPGEHRAFMVNCASWVRCLGKECLAMDPPNSERSTCCTSSHRANFVHLTQ